MMGSRSTKAHHAVPPLATSAIAGQPAQRASSTSSGSRVLQPYRYNTDKQAWEKVDAATAQESEEQELAKSSLRLVTYNVYFGEKAMRPRFRHILELLSELDADIVCLQEANMQWIEEMTDNKYVQDTFYASDVDGRTLNGYGVVLLSRLPIVNLSLWPLPTRMGRSALVATYHLNGETVSIGTVHLESLKSPQLRSEQLRMISKILAPSPHACLMGDFNFDAERNFVRGDGPLENDNLALHMSDYVDVWPALRSAEEKGYTFDSEVNRMIRQYEQMRYDRVMWKSHESKWQPRSIELVGTQPMKGHINVWPSDHFGLVVDLDYSTSVDSEEAQQEK